MLILRITNGYKYSNTDIGGILTKKVRLGMNIFAVNIAF